MSHEPTSSGSAPEANDQDGGDQVMAELTASLRADPRFSGYALEATGRGVIEVRVGAHRVLLVPGAHAERELCALAARGGEGESARLILLGRPLVASEATSTSPQVASIVPARPSLIELHVALREAIAGLALRASSESQGRWANQYRYELSELLEIARAMTTERETDKLLGLILEKARFITGADAGSVYVVEPDPDDPDRKVLHFKLTQNDSVSFGAPEFRMPMTGESLAGYAALRREIVRLDDVYAMPPGSPFRFDPTQDQRTGYRTRSMLCTPLVSSQGEAIGVLQLINKKREGAPPLLHASDIDDWVLPFDPRSEELLSTMAAQAGAALENALLYGEIRGLFEGFVRASVDAIEARDPTTSGHSRRVAELTLGLARAVEKEDGGPYAPLGFTREDLREIEYASLLHDFGKIGVRENVLLKAKKLHPHEFERVQQRFELARRSIQLELARREIDALRRGATPRELDEIGRELEERLKQLSDAWGLLVQANEPSILAEGDFERLERLVGLTFPTRGAGPSRLVEDDELHALTIQRGSLTPEEFAEIRSHVDHTYRFLSRIPWGNTFARVPVIAGAHHERLNGTGYPHRLHAEAIPVQSKMMTIADIFDALTASDRPYKRAVPLERALDILAYEVRDGHIDAELVRIFRAARIWEPVLACPV